MAGWVRGWRPTLRLEGLRGSAQTGLDQVASNLPGRPGPEAYMNEIFKRAIEEGASDLHIKAGDVVECYKTLEVRRKL